MNLPVEQTVTIGGNQYRLAKMSLSILGQFVEWAKTKIPDPFDKFAERFGACSDAVQKMAFERASKQAETYGTLDDPAVTSLMNSVDGAKHLLFLMFQKYQPHLTEADVAKIVEQALEEKGAGFLAEYFPADPQVGRPTPRKRN